MRSPCPEFAALEAHAFGRSSPDEAAATEAHVDSCAPCANALERIRADHAIEARVRALFAPAAPPRERIEGFRILRELGRGGMGVVFEAEQLSPPRRVALKVVRGASWVDATTLQLFQREIRALARLEHPGIASLYDAGSTADGEHWFAMELVRGEPLTRYAAGRPLAERLELFRQLCDAIDYAHQRGVVHRDLKPSNVLVDGRGRVQVLDFGLAKITDQDVAATTVLSEPGAIRGTLAYMSPEQARGDPAAVDQRSDVYSLGAVLYELLTARVPSDVSGVHVHEAARRICEEAPERPSRIDASLRGELETIVLKALEKEPERRYPSAAALGEDLRRHLADEPILARPPSGLYHARKLVARHRLAASLLAAVFALAVGTAVWTSVLYRRESVLRVEAQGLQTRAERASEQAELEAERARVRALTAERTKDFLVSVFEGRDHDRGDRGDPPASALLERGLDELQTQLADEPAVRAELLGTLGRVLRNLGRYRKSRPALEEALAIRRAEVPPDREKLAEALSDLGEQLGRQRESAGSIALLEEALALCREIEGEDGLSAAVLLSRIASSVKDAGDLPRAEALFRDVLARRRAELAEDDPDVLKAKNDLAMTLSQMLRNREAIALMEEVVRDSRRVLPRSLRLCGALNGLAIQCSHLGDYARAESLHLEAIALRSELVGEGDPAVGFSYTNLGQTYRHSGRPELGLACLLRAEEILVPVHGEESAVHAIVLCHLARARLDLREFDEATRLAERALAMQKRLLDPAHPDLFDSYELLGTVRFDVGDFRAAADAYCLASEGLASRLGERNKRTATARHNLGVALIYTRQYREAEAALLDAFATFEANGDDLRASAKWLGTLYRLTKRVEEAMPYERLARSAPQGS